MTYRLLILAILPLLAVPACDDDFSPKSDFSERLVVLAALDPSADVQVVRLARSYDADLGESLFPLTETEVHEAEVLLRGPGGTFFFHDTLYSTPDGQLRVWISREFVPAAEKFYRLEVKVPGFNKVTSETTAPSKVHVRVTTQEQSDGTGHVVVHTGVTAPRIAPHGYYFRLFVRIIKLVDGVETELREEVPLGRMPGTGEWEFPGLDKDNEQRFLKDLVVAVHDEMLADDDSLLISEHLVLYGCAFEKQFYNYFKIVRGFDDPVSLRLDDPDISYIEGGLGVFGIIMPDSAIVPYRLYVR